VERLIARRPDLRLLTAVIGRLGVDVARSSRPDMILMDINLPDINGFEALKMLRADSLTAQIPVVASSPNAMPRDIERGMEAGFFRYLTKPIKIMELKEMLQVTREFAAKESEIARVAGGLS
jgi:CheY-like chemotaxis protein